jgi:DNA-binding NtrC family response regulator
LAEEKEASGPLPLGSGERVLLVEDEEAAREALAEVLRSLGYQVTAVASAEEAGRLPAESAFQVLLTDFLLPGANGLQLATGLLDRWPGLKVVVMSGYSEDQLFKEQVEAGRLRFLPKPFTMEQLAQQLRAALGSPS